MHKNHSLYTQVCMHNMLEHTSKMKKSSGIKINNSEPSASNSFGLFTVCRTRPRISTDSSSVAGKNRCGSKKSFKVVRHWLQARPGSRQHQSAKGSPAPFSWFPLLQAMCRVGPAIQAAHGGMVLRSFSAFLLQPSHLSLLIALSGGVKGVCWAMGCHLQHTEAWGVKRWFCGISKL